MELATKLTLKSGLTLLTIAFLFLLPLVAMSPYILRIFIYIFMWAIMGISWNMLGGWLGQISLGHSSFLGLGAMVSTLLLVLFDVSPWIGMWIGALASISGSFVLGYITLRLRGLYFTLATVAYSLILYPVFLSYLNSLKYWGGEVPIPYRGDSFLYFQWSSKVPYYYFIFTFLLIVLYIGRRIERSSLGLYFAAIRDNEDAAESLGVNVLKFKIIAVVLSAFIAGMVGTFYAQLLYTVTPQAVFSVDISIMTLVVAVVGGATSIFGPIIGAAILVPIKEVTTAYFGAAYPGVHLVIYGVLLMLIITVMPEGIAIRLLRLLQGREDHAGSS